MIDDPEIRRVIEEEILERSRDLAPYEQIKKFLVISRNFRIDDEELTPTLKIRRHHLEERYRGLIDRMYE